MLKAESLTLRSSGPRGGTLTPEARCARKSCDHAQPSTAMRSPSWTTSPSVTPSVVTVPLRLGEHRDLHLHRLEDDQGVALGDGRPSATTIFQTFATISARTSYERVEHPSEESDIARERGPPVRRTTPARSRRPGGRVVRHAEAEPLHGVHRPRVLGGLRDEVLEGVDDLDDPAGHRQRLVRGLVRPAIGIGLPLDDQRDVVQDPGLADDGRAELGDVALLGAIDHDRRPAGDRVGKGQLAEVVHEGGVGSTTTSSSSAHAQLTTDGQAQSLTRCAWPVSV